MSINNAKVMNIITQDVAKHLDIDPEDIFWLQVEMGAKYLVEYFGKENATQIEIMKANPDFWSWFRQAWANEDRKILHNVSKLSAVEMIRNGYSLKFYKRVHAPEKMTLTPNSVVMEGYYKQLRSITKKPVTAH